MLEPHRTLLGSRLRERGNRSRFFMDSVRSKFEGQEREFAVYLPPSYLLIHRVWLGGIGVLCQLGATVRVPDVLAESLPGYAD